MIDCRVSVPIINATFSPGPSAVKDENWQRLIDGKTSSDTATPWGLPARTTATSKTPAITIQLDNSYNDGEAT